MNTQIDFNKFELQNVENGNEITRTHLNANECVIVWLEVPVKSNDIDIFSELKIFYDRDECIDYITTDSNDHYDRITKRVLLVTSKEAAGTLVPLIYQLKQITSIYIFDDTAEDKSNTIEKNKPIQPRILTTCQKIRGEYCDKNLLCKQISDDFTQFEQYHLPFAVCSPSIYKETSTQSLKQESATFMWSYLLIHALTKMHSVRAKVDMLEECRQCYADNPAGLQKIDEFEKDYDRSAALWWYTRDSFVYRLLNKAFRLKNIDIIFKFRFIITDLIEQLRTLQTETHPISSSSSILSVYRGQYMAIEEIDCLKENIGGRITLNTFSSTSIDAQTARSFIFDSINSEGDHAVLFEITIDTKLSITSPYAKISSVSAMPDECEVLLSVGMILCINSVEKQQLGESDYWLIKLQLQNDEVLSIKQLLDSFKSDIDKQESDLIIFSNVLWHMGDYDRAEKYSKSLLNELETNDSYRANVYNMLGLIYAEKSLYDEAVEAYNTSIDIRRQTQSEDDHIDFAPVYSNLGCVCTLKQNYIEALNFYQKAFDLGQRNLPENDLQLSTYIMNIALAYDNLNDYEKSLKFYKKALEILLTHIQFDHPSIAAIYNNIASIYRKLCDYERSMEYQQIAHMIWTKTLPPFHSSVVQSHDNLGTVYASLLKYDEALKHFHLALKILENHHSHVNENALVASCINNIATIYLTEEKFEQALTYFEKALEIYKRYKQNASIATIYDNIGTLYSNISDFSKAIENYSKSIEFHMLQLPDIDKCSLAQTFDHVGLIQFHLGMYGEALQSFQSASDLVDCVLPSDHPSVVEYRNHIEMTNDQVLL
ncbi:unnamed protein product [Didymodactylos carnosus]|uniref:NAD(P)(+)--arginine ADP-ribosyltransferase n=1 Tax=Didymodactylos carnosus TaxID=1234261 RepID=A0A814A7F3_9BILA|nr:unnamed protein product [Didymodactylos carnosus]CAF1136645.1 unnamed protein product [Didymodactylos carnosus]CAF3689899.1 unnamed protein product [Didymodactylos carnosus]CAF3926372.1 unnamed protein product [Didymodactylos carnosus]